MKKNLKNTNRSIKKKPNENFMKKHLIKRIYRQRCILVHLKVAHHIWIKFLNSRRNSLMMKNEVKYTCMTDMDKQKANEKLFFGKNMTFKKLFQ